VPSKYGRFLIRNPTISSIKNDLRKIRKNTVARTERIAEETPKIRENTGLYARITKEL